MKVISILEIVLWLDSVLMCSIPLFVSKVLSIISLMYDCRRPALDLV
jgi:hypothetical protein